MTPILPRAVPMALAMVSLLGGAVGCSGGSKAEDREPLPTVAAGDLVCGFVSKASAAVALGTADFHAAGARQELAGVKNPDGSSLGTAICNFTTPKATGVQALVSVQQLGVLPSSDNFVPEFIASGRAEYVFPAAEGLGFAGTNKTVSGAGSANLIVGDWHYVVTISNPVEGRNSMEDAIALVRQIVATLGLPKVGTLPRPTATPSK